MRVSPKDAEPDRRRRGHRRQVAHGVRSRQRTPACRRYPGRPTSLSSRRGATCRFRASPGQSARGRPQAEGLDAQNARLGAVTQRPPMAPTLSAPMPLADHHDAAAFDCGEPALNEWLRNRARKSEGRFARTYVVCDGARIAGYFCIAVGSVERAGAPKKLQRNAPDPVPIAIIGRFAVDIGYAGRGLGKDLLQDAFKRIVSISEIAGVSAVLVHAKKRRGPRVLHEVCGIFRISRREPSALPADRDDRRSPVNTRRRWSSVTSCAPKAKQLRGRETASFRSSASALGLLR